ncbi:MAG: insulinase family protein [Prevotellaceae bacterium]|nr:insulinase family protein [Prevotellaceae bacterium]
MKKVLVLIPMLLMAVMVMAQGFQVPEIPMDPDVKKGKLDNGLTYYVRKNAYPEKRVNFYIAQKVGSIQEEESQRGLAHFLEHMCFNGTKNFPGNGVIRYCESLGVQFGSDLNAYTSIDQTVYRICNVPSTRQSALDSCLLIIHDWANALLLEGEEIDKERGVIHEEYRLRMGAQSRMLERSLETLYPGSKYGKRFPIGLMSVVDNFKYDELRSYYQKWYRPDNQAVIVVGDVDVDYTVNKIKEMFGGIKMPENPAPVVAEQVPDNAEPIVIIEKDKEQQYSIVEMLFKHEATPESQNSTVAYLLKSYMDFVISHMLNARIEEAALNPDCPFIQASGSDGQYIYSKTKDAFTLAALPKEGKIYEAAAAIYREALRAAKFGFTATEYARAQAEYQSIIEKQYTNREKRHNDSWGNDCRDNFLENYAIPSMEFTNNFAQQAASQIPVILINQMIKELVSVTDSNLVVINFNQEKEGAVYPERDKLLQAIQSVRAEELTAYVDNVKSEPIMSEMPKAGKIKKETDFKYGFKKLTLSNGATVYLKQTDFKADQVLLEGMAKGGKAKIDAPDFSNMKLMDGTLSVSGIGNFDSQELQKALAGKQANASLEIGNNFDVISGSSTPKDIETMFQLLYKKVTDTQKDQKAFDNIKTMYITALKNKSLTPSAVCSDSVQATLYSHNPRFTNVDVSDVEKVDYDRSLEIAKSHFANAANFSFFIVGNYDEANIRDLICQYIASLPSKNKADASWKDVTSYAKGNIVNRFEKKMETPTANSYMFWLNTKAEVTPESMIKADAAGQILDMVYTKEIREEASAAYSAQALGRAQKGGLRQLTQLVGVCPFKYEKEDSVMLLMRQGAENLSKNIDPDMLTKVKEYMLKNYENQQKTNGYWINVAEDDVFNGMDTDTNYKSIVNSLTPANVASYVKEVMLGGDAHIEVIMMPDLK